MTDRYKEAIQGARDCVERNKDGGVYLPDLLRVIDSQQAENKELKTANLILSQKRFNIFERIEFTDKLKKQIKAEAIKEFAEKMKGVIPEIDDTYIERIVEDYIDNLVNEMVGEQDV